MRSRAIVLLSVIAAGFHGGCLSSSVRSSPTIGTTPVAFVPTGEPATRSPEWGLAVDATGIVLFDKPEYLEVGPLEHRDATISVHVLRGAGGPVEAQARFQHSMRGSRGAEAGVLEATELLGLP